MMIFRTSDVVCALCDQLYCILIAKSGGAIQSVSELFLQYSEDIVVDTADSRSERELVSLSCHCPLSCPPQQSGAWNSDQT